MRRAADERGLRGPHRDRPAGPSVAVRPVGRPAGAARGPCAAADGAGPDRRRRHGARGARSSAAPVHPGRRSRPIAVCFLHADRWPASRATLVARRARAREASTSSPSHDVSPEHREYERLVTTVVNAYVQPVVPHLPVPARRLRADGAGHDLGRRPRAPRPSRRAPGVAAAVRARRRACAPQLRSRAANGWPNAVSFDMGGTSTDVCLIAGGVPAPAPSREIGGFPVRLPALDIHTHRRGRWIDRATSTRVARSGSDRESAGADPGPGVLRPWRRPSRR